MKARLAWALLGAALSPGTGAVTPAAAVPRAVVTAAAPLRRQVPATPTPTPTTQYGKVLVGQTSTPTRTPTVWYGKALVAMSPTPTKPPHSREIVIGFTGNTPAQSREIQINFVGTALPGGPRAGQ